MYRSLLVLATATVCATGAVQAADDARYRRSTRPALETNGNERIFYAPILSSTGNAAPRQLPHRFPLASWRLQPVGSQHAAPSRVSSADQFTLERFEMESGDGTTTLRAVVSTTWKPAEGGPFPVLRVIHPESLISATATAAPQPAAARQRYVFLLQLPHSRLRVRGTRGEACSLRYHLDFLSSQDAQRQPCHSGASGFGGLREKVSTSEAPQPDPSPLPGSKSDAPTGSREP